MPKGGWREFSGPESLQRPEADSAPTPRGLQKVRVQRTRAGKGGKLVTAITGLEAPPKPRRASCSNGSRPPPAPAAPSRTG